MLEMLIKYFVPTKFMGRYPLSIGATLYAIIFACLKTVCIIAVAWQMNAFADCHKCTRSVRRVQLPEQADPTEKSAYGFSGAFIMISSNMLFIHLLYLWYAQRMISSVVLVWVVTTAIWLGQTFCLTLVLLCLYTDDVSLMNWSLSLAFGLVAYAIAIYGVLVGYGLYREIKRPTNQS